MADKARHREFPGELCVCRRFGICTPSQKFGDAVQQFARSWRSNHEIIDQFRRSAEQSIVGRQDSQGGHANRISRQTLKELADCLT
jgi:hypothetical protein